MTDLHFTGASPDELWPLVRDFHYSKRMAGLVRFAFALREAGGLFGDTGRPVVGVIFSQPVNRNFPTTSLELSRLIRADNFDGQISEFVCAALRWIRANTATPFVLSYADTGHGHHGGIYQACNFHYVGKKVSNHIGFNALDGSFIHGRNCNSRFGTRSVEKIAKIKPDWSPVYGEPKHLYIFPIRQKWASIARNTGWRSLSYPKPSAARLLDEPEPTGVSEAQTLGAAPELLRMRR